jgi:hypothetical protein
MVYITTAVYSPSLRPLVLASIPSVNLKAVDECSSKESLIHMAFGTFLQVRGRFGVKVFLYPQVVTQAVHKQGPLIHNLSTAVHVCGLGGQGNGY